MVSHNPRLVLIIGFITITLLLVGVVSVGLQRMVTIGDNMDGVINVHSEHTTHIQNMIATARERSILLHKIALIEDPVLIEEQIEILYELGSQFITAKNTLAASSLDEDELQLLEKQAELTNQALPIQYQVIELAREGRTHQALQLVQNEALPLQDKVIQVLNQLANIQTLHNQQAMLEANNALRDARNLMLQISLPALILGSIIIAYVARRINVMTRDLWRRDTQLASTNKTLEEKLTELSRTQQELASSEAKERAIRENMLDAIITIDEQGIIDSCNPAAEKMFGYSADEMLGNNVVLLMPDTYRTHHDQHVNRYMQGAEPLIIGMARDLSGQRKDGSIFPLDIGITRLEIDGQVKVIGILRDITKRKQAEEALQRSHDELEQLVAKRTGELVEANERLQQMANYDSLTGLPNRALFHEHLKLATAHARRTNQWVAILFLDLDGFKPVNDEYGHELGDQLLREVASIFKGCVREEDTVARIGGDEFTLILGSLSYKNYAAKVAEKLLAALDRTIICDGKEIHIGASIGISLYPIDSDDLDIIIQKADEAMYQAKKRGKNQFVFYQSNDTKITDPSHN